MTDLAPFGPLLEQVIDRRLVQLAWAPVAIQEPWLDLAPATIPAVHRKIELAGCGFAFSHWLLSHDFEPSPIVVAELNAGLMAMDRLVHRHLVGITLARGTSGLYGALVSLDPVSEHQHSILHNQLAPVFHDFWGGREMSQLLREVA